MVSYIIGEMKAKVFENRILRRMYCPKRNEYGEKRRFHNEELHALYRLPNIVRLIKCRRLRWTGLVARMEEDRNSFKILTGKPIGKISLGRPRRMWEENIRMDFKGIGINTRSCVDLAQDRDYWRVIANAALNKKNDCSNILVQYL